MNEFYKFFKCGTCHYFSNALSFDLNMILTKNNIANKINLNNEFEDCLRQQGLSH